MLIAPAWAHGSLVRAEGSGGGTALLIILAAAIAFLFIYRCQKRWRKLTPSRAKKTHRVGRIEPLE